MPKCQPRKTTLKGRRSSVGILLSGLERIAAGLHSYGTLSDERRPCLKLLRMPGVLPTLPLHCISDSVALPASEVHVDCSFVLETILTLVILENQMQGRGLRGSTSCSKTLATVSQRTGEIFRLSMQCYSILHHLPQFISPAYIAEPVSCYHLSPYRLSQRHLANFSDHSRCGDGTFNLIATRKFDFIGALHTH